MSEFTYRLALRTFRGVPVKKDTLYAKVPKITNFGLWDFKKFFIENTMAEDVVFLNPHQAPEVIMVIRKNVGLLRQSFWVKTAT